LGRQLQHFVKQVHHLARLPIRLDDRDVERLVDEWRDQGRPASLLGYRFPRCAARLCLMWERLMDDGFTSYWL